MRFIWLGAATLDLVALDDALNTLARFDLQAKPHRRIAILRRSLDRGYGSPAGKLTRNGEARLVYSESVATTRDEQDGRR